MIPASLVMHTRCIAGPTGPFGRRVFHGQQKQLQFLRVSTGIFGLERHTIIILSRNWCRSTGVGGGISERGPSAIWAAISSARYSRFWNSDIQRPSRQVQVPYGPVCLLRHITLKADPCRHYLHLITI